MDAIEDCMSSAFLINLATLEADAQSFAGSKKIDPLNNLVNHVCLDQHTFFTLSLSLFLNITHVLDIVFSIQTDSWSVASA
jgi:hypothetical protein